ncbi:unnamed protein product [Linum trigynum]|uniref:Uncharacterized protein n=1 Tax=Linum trigynum TaxID=586398 RepID=A0AAV2E533_9ROSI
MAPKQEGFILVVTVVLFLLADYPSAVVGSINGTIFPSIVETLPGFSGPLPFKLETGYVDVAEKEAEESELLYYYYYFIESERNPDEDPLLLWLTGGPGCSALSGLLFEIGPLRFEVVEYNGTLPNLVLNPHSWTKVASIIFMDGPIGTGFSYSTTFQGSITGDTTYAHQTARFLTKWLMRHPRFLKNPLYIAGDSYSGMVVPIITHILSSSSSAADEAPWTGQARLNLKGYLLGNAAADMKSDLNSRTQFAHRMGLISDELYRSAKRDCKGEYVEVDPANVKCMEDLQAISKCTGRINRAHILEQKCTTTFRTFNVLDGLHQWSLLHQKTEEFPLIPADFPHPRCRGYNSYLCNIWANDINVQKALHAWKDGELRQWIRCNESLHYIRDVWSTVKYHHHLNVRGFPALIYSGDHDMVIPYIGTVAWIKALNLSIVEKWRPWLVDGQVAGYTKKYANGLTFATFQGGGHTAPEYNPRECFAMFSRWISGEPL